VKRLIAGAVCAVLILVPRAPRADEGTVEGLAAAERAFSALSVERGMRDAFLAFLSDRSFLFRPLPVDGRAVWQDRQPVPGTLIWEPSYVEVSSSGDLGLSTGPWEYRPAPGAADSTIAHGHFVTMWSRDSSSTWRVALDLGVSHEKPERGLKSGVFVTGPDHGRAPARAVDPAALSRGLTAMDASLSAGAGAHGAARAFQAAAARDARIYREGEQPATTSKTAAARFVEGAGTPRWTPWGAGASRAGDLGYTYGVVERTATGGAAPVSAS